MISTTVLLTLSLQCSPTIHPDTSLDVAKLESGLNPFSIGVVGQKKGIFPRNLTDALAHIDKLKANGKNFSVGLMQINKTNFSRYGVTAKQLFDPCINLSVFEKIITDCYRRGGTLKRALSCYYSGNFDTGKKPETAFSKTSYLQRMGYKPVHYIVPSSQADKAKQNASRVEPTPPIRYPKGIVRGEFIVTSSH